MRTHREKVLTRLGLDVNKSYSLSALAKATGTPRSILQEVYNRGIGAYNTNPTSVRLKRSFIKNVSAPMSQKLSKQQWAMARTYSYLDHNPKHDQDLHEKERSM
jgi:hypothetical protein